jgi:hypothetical protein
VAAGGDAFRSEGKTYPDGQIIGRDLAHALAEILKQRVVAALAASSAGAVAISMLSTEIAKG